MKYYTEKFWQRIWQEIYRDCKDIKVNAGELRFNYKCHVNAWHHALKEDHEEIAAVFYQMPDTLRPSIHFVNYDGENYIDNTIGYLAESTSYYLIRMIPKIEFEKNQPWDYLQKFKEYYQSKATFMQRTFGDLSM